MICSEILTPVSFFFPWTFLGFEANWLWFSFFPFMVSLYVSLFKGFQFCLYLLHNFRHGLLGTTNIFFFFFFFFFFPLWAELKEFYNPFYCFHWQLSVGSRFLSVSQVQQHLNVSKNSCNCRLIDIFRLGQYLFWKFLLWFLYFYENIWFTWS